MDLISWILLTVCLIIFFKYAPAILDYFRYIRKLYIIPGPGKIPYIGPLFELRSLDKEGRMQWLIQKDKEFADGIFKSWLPQSVLIHVRKPEHLEGILRSTVNIRKSIFYEFIEPWLGQGLLTSTGDKWFRDRKLLTPAFHFNVLEPFALLMTEKIDIFFKCVEQELQKDPKKPINIAHFITMCTLDIICETAMGINIHAQEEQRSEYVENLHRFSTATLQRLTKPWTRWNTIFYMTKDGKNWKGMINVMHNFTNQVIQKRKLRRRQEKEQKGEIRSEEVDDNIGKRKKKAFLDLLLDLNENNHNQLTDEEIREQVDTIMFAGHETTAAAVAWCLFRLGNHLEVQEKLHRELDDAFGSSTEPATFRQISELEYLDRVMKECLRLHPSAPNISRKLVTDVKIAGYVFPKDTTLSLSPYLTHRDPDHWPNPEKFDPDRFLPENSKNRHPYAYIPFSAGPRNCIGKKFAQMEEKIMITSILRKWRVKSVHTPENVRYYSALTLHPSDGIHVYLTPKQ